MSEIGAPETTPGKAKKQFFIKQKYVSNEN